MKTNQQIADDCGISELSALLKTVMNTPDGEGGADENLHLIIGALYRRIEKLEEEKNEALSMLPRVVGYVRYFDAREGCEVTLRDLNELIAKYRKEIE